MRRLCPNPNLPLYNDMRNARPNRPAPTGRLEDEPGAADFIEAHEAKVRSIRIPSLQIHGAADDLAPIELAAELYNQLENESREFVAIEGAGHNDILWIGRSEYFAAIRAFVDSLL